MNQERLDILEELYIMEKFTVDLDLGEIYGVKGGKLHGINPSGTHHVSLSYPGKRSINFNTAEVIAFIHGMDIIDKCVCHIDNDQSNNSIHNLEVRPRNWKRLKKYKS